MKLIDKSALVAEIDKLKNISLEYGYTTEQRIVADVGKDLTLEGLLDYIDTLEVKEVDLEKEIERVIKIIHENHYTLGIGWTQQDAYDIAKHFLNLGITVSNKAQKGE